LIYIAAAKDAHNIILKSKKNAFEARFENIPSVIEIDNNTEINVTKSKVCDW